MEFEYLSVADVVDSLGIRLSNSMDYALRLAIAAQSRRADLQTADGQGLTESVALWSALTADAAAAAAAADTGLGLGLLSDQLSSPTVPDAFERDRLPALPDLATIPVQTEVGAAVRVYVSSGQAALALTPLDLARAIVQAAGRGDDAGAVSLFLKSIGVAPFDLDRALFGSAFSKSVRAVRSRLMDHEVVSAVSIARELQRVHPEYAGSHFREVDFDKANRGLEPSLVPPSSEARPPPTVDDWLQLVRQQYEPDLVAASRHRVLNGELVLLGLVRKDKMLDRLLAEHDVTPLLEKDVEVRPVGEDSQAPLELKQAWTRWSGDDVDPDCAKIHDHLGRRYLAAALATRLRSIGENPGTFMVHIDGPWGAGKSTLLKLLKCQLGEDYVIVEFNAWREQRVGIQWWTLYKSVRRAVQAAAPGRLRVWFDEARVSVSSQPLPLIVGLVTAAVLVGVLFAVDFDLQDSASWVEAPAKLLTSLGVIAAGATASIHYVLPETRRSAEGFVKRSSNPMEKVQKLFHEALKRSPRPVVLLVDDLDRCEPEYVIEFLEVLQTLVRPAGREVRGDADGLIGPYAFVAADGQWLRSSYEAKYDATKVESVPGRPLGYRFLEKVFQLQLRLPAVPTSMKEHFYRTLLALPPSSQSIPEDNVERLEARAADASTGEEIAQVARDAHGVNDPQQRVRILGRAAVRLAEKAITTETEHALIEYSRYLEANPRTIRLFVNSFGVQRSLRLLEEYDVPLDTLARWTILEVRWPQLADHLRQHPEDITRHEATGEAIEVPRAITRLLSEPNIKNVLLGDEGKEALTADDVRMCTGGRPG